MSLDAPETAYSNISVKKKQAAKLREESQFAYSFGGYCPLTPKQILRDGRYVLVRKLGFGVFSTVWLAYDLTEERHCVCKVVRASQAFTQAAYEEIQMLKKVARTSKESDHPGKEYIVSIRDHFKHHSANGQHVVIVEEVLGESLLNFLNENEALELPVVKHIAKQLLQALAFLHEDCSMISTDLKTPNILIGIHDPEVVIRQDPELRQASQEAIAHAKATKLREPSPHRVAAVPINAAIRAGARGPSPNRKPHQVVRSLPIASPPISYRVRFESTTDQATSPSSPTSSTISSTFSKSPELSTGTTSALSESTFLTSCSIAPTDLCSSLSALGILARDDIRAGDCKDCGSIKTAQLSEGFPNMLDLPKDDKRVETAPLKPKTSHGTVEWENMPLSVKICDFGNATDIEVHACYDIQTLEYRAPEVLLGKDWDESVDIWSLGCILFECATGERLFNPKDSGDYSGFTKEDDLLAMIQELLGNPFTPEMLAGGAYASRYFTSKAKMRRIKQLSYWTLYEVLVDKYLFSKGEAMRFSKFLRRMLTMDRNDRAKARDLLEDPFLTDLTPASDDISPNDLERIASATSLTSSHSSEATPDLVASTFSDRSRCSSPALALVTASGVFDTGLADLQCSDPWEVTKKTSTPTPSMSRRSSQRVLQ